MALCSLSTGTIALPAARAAASTNGPPATMLSLLARASVAPALSAARLARRPAAPTIPFSTTSSAAAARAAAAALAISSAMPSSPARTGRSVARRRRGGRRTVGQGQRGGRATRPRAVEQAGAVAAGHKTDHRQSGQHGRDLDRLPADRAGGAQDDELPRRPLSRGLMHRAS